MSQITTHVLDTQSGKPAKGVEILLSMKSTENFVLLASGQTNSDGRITDLLDEGYKLEKGIYKMEFKIEDYFTTLEIDTFYPRAEIIFRIENTTQHYHIPLLLSPFGYTTYRGS